MQNMGSDPGYRVSHMTVARKRVTMCDKQLEHGANTGISYNTHAYGPRRCLGVIPSRRAIGTVLVQCKVEEVDVLGTFEVEVGVHDDGRGTRDLGGGSRSRS